MCSYNQFIGYRESNLTRILQNALGGNSKTVIVATINPTTVEESHSTLRVSGQVISLGPLKEVFFMG
jgi:hypothetical protein